MGKTNAFLNTEYYRTSESYYNNDGKLYEIIKSSGSSVGVSGNILGPYNNEFIYFQKVKASVVDYNIQIDVKNQNNLIDSIIIDIRDIFITGNLIQIILRTNMKL